MSSQDECPICISEIDKTNNFMISECGHNFHASCLIGHIAYQGCNGSNCPMCNFSLTKPSIKLYDECPICISEIDKTNNFMISECGHKFHASCLIRHIANQGDKGSNCPICRFIFIEPTQKSSESLLRNDEYFSVENINLNNEDDNLLNDNNNILRGFRFFFNNIYGINHDEDDNFLEEMANELAQRNHGFLHEILPSADLITKELIDQDITFEKFVEVHALFHQEEELSFETQEIYTQNYYELVNKIQNIIFQINNNM